MQNIVKVRLGDKDANEYSVLVMQHSETAGFAVSELIKYLYKIGVRVGACYTRGAGAHIVFDCREETKDGFSIFFKGDDLYLQANNGRSLLYAVYELLERLGWRFFAPQATYRGLERGAHTYACEKFIGGASVALPKDVNIRQEAVFDYRDGSSPVTRADDVFCVKLRLNAETWRYRSLSEELGGAMRFAGSTGHTFERLLPLSKFAKTHPEFYAEIDGERRLEGAKMTAPQYCLTNFDSVPFVAEAAKEVIKSVPNARYVSVSQNDSNLHCQCAACQKSYEKYGNFGTLINYVNKVAELIEKDYPEVLVHTYVYEWSTRNFKTGVKAKRNVLAQWCPTEMCRNHALNDASCPLNRHWYNQLQNLSKVCENVFIYDYRSCLKYSMLLFTDIFTLRDTMRAYAENNVRGIYSELCIHTYNQPTFEELRGYLFGKLTWNPYISAEEYERHIKEFLAGYYGAGWEYLYEYLKVWSNANPELHYTSFYGELVGEDGWYVTDEDGNVVSGHIFKDEELAAAVKTLNGLLDKALELADAEHKERIEIVRTGLIWYELYHTMSTVLETGAEAEKAAIIARNRDLCSRMRKYQMKYTTYIGMTNITYMYDDFSLSPDKWHYKGGTEKRKVF